MHLKSKIWIITDRFPDLLDDQYTEFLNQTSEPKIFASEFDYFPKNSVQLKRKLSMTSLFSYIGFVLRNFPLIFDSVNNVKRLKSCIFWLREGYISYASMKNSHDTEPKVIYCFWGDYRAFGATVYGVLNNIPVIIRFHGWDLEEERHVDNYLPFRKFFGRKARVLLFISETGKDYFLKKHAVFREKCLVNYLGVQKKSEHYIEREWLDHSISFVSVSNLIPLKRVDLIAKTLNELSKFYAVQWDHFGEGCDSEKVQEVINQSGNRSFCLRGYVQREELLQTYQSNKYHFLINLSDTEGLPVSMMEALSYGIPIISFNVGGVSELVKEEVTGYCLNQRSNPEILALEIQGIIEKMNQEKYDELVVNCRTNFSIYFDSQMQTRKLIRDLKSFGVEL